MSRGRRQDRGVTLIEILVALAIVTMLIVVVAVGYKRLSSTALRREAVKLAAAMRSAYDHAAASNAYHRVVMDLDEQTYLVERCEGKLVVRRSADQREEQRLKEDEELRRRQEQAAAEVGAMSPEKAAAAIAQVGGIAPTPGTTVGGAAGGSAAQTCQPLKGAAGKAHKLSTNPRVRIAKVWVSHYDAPATAGRVMLNFFPFGRAERAVVELDAGEEQHPDAWSVVLHPLNGRVVVQKGVPRNASDLVGEDAEGKRQ